MSARFVDPRVVDLAEATRDLRTRRRLSRDQSRRRRTWKLRRLSIPGSALWVVVFYAALGACTALWWHWDQVGLPRLLMGTALLFAVLLGAGREVAWLHPVWVLLTPAAIIVAAFFWYPLAPTAVVLAIVFVGNMLWFG